MSTRFIVVAAGLLTWAALVGATYAGMMLERYRLRANIDTVLAENADMSDPDNLFVVCALDIIEAKRTGMLSWRSRQ